MPRKLIYIFSLVDLQSLDRGMNKITQAFFCHLSQNFNTTRSGDSCLVGHPIVHANVVLLLLLYAVFRIRFIFIWIRTLVIC